MVFARERCFNWLLRDCARGGRQQAGSGKAPASWRSAKGGGRSEEEAKLPRPVHCQVQPGNEMVGGFAPTLWPVFDRAILRTAGLLFISTMETFGRPRGSVLRPATAEVAASHGQASCPWHAELARLSRQVHGSARRGQSTRRVFGRFVHMRRYWPRLGTVPFLLGWPMKRGSETSRIGVIPSAIRLRWTGLVTRTASWSVQVSLDCDAAGAASHWQASCQWHPELEHWQASCQWHPELEHWQASCQWHPELEHWQASCRWHPELEHWQASCRWHVEMCEASGTGVWFRKKGTVHAARVWALCTYATFLAAPWYSPLLARVAAVPKKRSGMPALPGVLRSGQGCPPSRAF